MDWFVDYEYHLFWFQIKPITFSNDLDKDTDFLMWMQNGDFVHQYLAKNIPNTMKSEQNDLKTTFERACKCSSCE